MRRLSDKEMAKVCGGRAKVTPQLSDHDQGSATAEPFLLRATPPPPTRFDLTQQSGFAKPPKHLRANHKSQNKVGVQSCALSAARKCPWGAKACI